MRKLLLTGALLLGLGIGMMIGHHDQHWERVRVVRDGILVANPASLTAEELADAVIINPRETVELVRCKPDCQNWKEINYVR